MKENVNNDEKGKLAPSAFDKLLVSIDKTLFFIEDKITLACFIGMTLAVLYGVVMRFVLKMPNMFGEEISRYLCVMSVFLGIGIVERSNENMKVDLLTNALPKKAATAILFIARFIAFVAYCLLAKVTFGYISRISQLGQLSTCLRLPMYVVYIPVLVGFILGAVHILIQVWNQYFAKVKHGAEDDGVSFVVN